MKNKNFKIKDNQIKSEIKYKIFKYYIFNNLDLNF